MKIWKFLINSIITIIIIYLYFQNISDWSPILLAMAKQRIIYQVRIARLPIVPFIISTSAWLLCWAVLSCTSISLPVRWTVNKMVLWFILCGGALCVYVQVNISVRSNKLGGKYLNLVVTLYVIRSLVDCFVLGDKKNLCFIWSGEDEIKEEDEIRYTNSFFSELATFKNSSHVIQLHSIYQASVQNLHGQQKFKPALRIYMNFYSLYKEY